MLPSHHDLTYFVEASRTLNVSRAAERLGISQPSLSLAIRRLERDVGVSLFVRGRTGIQLTRAGTRLAVQARRLLEEWDCVRSLALRGETEPAGRYVLGCHSSVALYSLHRALPALLRKHRSLELRLLHDLSRKVADEVIGFRADFALVVNPPRHPDLVVRHLFEDRVTLWTSPKRGELNDPHSGSAVLICDPELVQTQKIQRQLASRQYRFAREVTTSNLDVAASLTAAGCGVGVLPGRVAGEYSRGRGKPLVPVSVEAPGYDDVICLVYRSDAQRSRASRAVASGIESALSSRR